MHAWMKRHIAFLMENGEWFARLLSCYAGQMQCARGCSLCCHGLFDISFVDALLLAEGYSRLPAPQQEDVFARARQIQNAIERKAPDLDRPFLLHGASEGLADRIVEAARNPRCPLLGDQDECLVYEFRPLACRLEGAPMADTRDGLFGDWCELNFTGGVPPAAMDLLTRDYYAIQAAEDTSNEVMTELLLGKRIPEATVFIPSVITEYPCYWRKLTEMVFGLGITADRERV